jgi:hypothetical protein
VSISLASLPAVVAAIRTAASIDLSAYTLSEGAVRDALVAAATRGAAVRVRLERDPLDDARGTLHAANADAVRRLQAAGADAALRDPAAPVLHLKVATTDGVAWLADRNWTAGPAGETILRDTDPADVAAVRTALHGGDGRSAHLRTTKSGAQALEADLIRTAGRGQLDVESESFGAGSIAGALRARALAGLPLRLLVAGREADAPGPAGARERRLLASLAAAGVAVRTGDPGGADVDEKLAAGASGAWAGSANATFAGGAAGRQQDWGVRTRDPALVAGLRAAFERNWAAARPFTAAGTAPARSPS